MKKKIARGKMLDSLLKPLYDICGAIVFIWNGIAQLINFLLGIITAPIGFLKWIFFQSIDFIIGLMPVIPESLRLQTAIDGIANISGIPAGFILELGEMASQFLLIAAVIKIYKLIPFKAS